MKLYTAYEGAHAQLTVCSYIFDLKSELIVLVIMPNIDTILNKHSSSFFYC